MQAAAKCWVFQIISTVAIISINILIALWCVTFPWCHREQCC